jgi:hypothetical protein
MTVERKAFLGLPRNLWVEEFASTVDQQVFAIEQRRLRLEGASRS